MNASVSPPRLMQLYNGKTFWKALCTRRPSNRAPTYRSSVGLRAPLWGRLTLLRFPNFRDHTALWVSSPSESNRNDRLAHLVGHHN